MNKFIKFYVLFAILSFAASYARADSYHGISYEENYTYDAPTHIENSKNYTHGASLAIAMSQINFDWSTQKNQVSVGVGSFDNQDAISFGFGKRFGGVLINGSIGKEGSKSGYGVGFGLRF